MVPSKNITTVCLFTVVWNNELSFILVFVEKAWFSLTKGRRYEMKNHRTPSYC